MSAQVDLTAVSIPTILETAQLAVKNGCSVVPIRNAGKAPDLNEWGTYQKRLPTEGELQAWFGNGQHTALGLVGGEVSGGIEILDFDSHEVYDAFCEAACHCGLTGTLVHLEKNYSERSPNGQHWVYRCVDEGPDGTAPITVPGNTVLAKLPKEKGKKQKVLIETRGEGGQALIAPSAARPDQDGDYVLEAGTLETIPLLWKKDRERLHTLARTFDQQTKRKEHKPRRTAPSVGKRPGDDYNAKIAWPELLEPHGWTQVYTKGETIFWCRPNKDGAVSATTNHDGSDRFYPFTSSTDFDNTRSYDLFAAYTVLEHDGDFKKAAKQLASEGYGDHDPATIEWETPEPIETRLKPVPSLPEQLIPEPFRKWILDVTHRMQTPCDFAAVTAMTVAASIIGTACAIRPKQRDCWTVIPNLWGACIGRPSVVLKSPSMKEPLDMLVRLQGEAGEIFEDDQRSYEFDKKVAEIKSKHADKAILKAVTAKDAQAVDACRDDFVNAAEIPEPVRRLYKTNETSIQSQTVLQAQNPRGLLTFRDEITGLLSRWDTKDYEDERAYFLEGWNGDNSYTDFKIGRGLTDAPQICISLFGGIQPDRLRRYLYQSMNGNNDGLVQRLQLAVYPDEPTDWTLVDQYPDTAEKTRVFEIMRKLANLDFAQVGAEQSEYDKFPFLRFTSDGQAVFNEWYTQLETDKLRNEEGSSLILEHLGKYRSLMPTLALVIHLIGVVDGTAEGAVSRQAAIQAAAWCDYLEGHARRIYACVMSPAQEAAAILAERIHRLPDPFTVKDVYRKGWTLLKTRQEVEAACRILEDADWLKMERLESETGRPPLPRYWINPALVERK